MIKKGIALVSIFALCIGLAFASTTSPQSDDAEIESRAMLTGTVTDAETGEAIPQAEIILNELGESITTDEYGSFTFDEVEAGTYTVSVTVDGYQTAEESVEVMEEGAHVEIELEASES